MSDCTRCICLCMLALVAACNDERTRAETEDPENCRSIPDSAMVDGKRLVFEFDEQALELRIETRSGSELWSREMRLYRQLSDFVSESDTVNLGAFIEREVVFFRRSTDSVRESHELDEEGRLVELVETTDHDSDVVTTTTVFDTWDESDRPIRGHANRTYLVETPLGCDLIEMNYRYVDDENQLVVETIGGTPAGCEPQRIRRFTFDRFGNQIRHEAWNAGADINVEEPDFVVETEVDVTGKQQICL